MEKILNKKGIKAALLAVNLGQLGTMLLSSVIADISKQFPEVSDQTVQFLMTTPGLFILVSSLISAYLTAAISKKRLTVVGIIMTLVSTVGGMFLNQNIILLYIWSALLGTGLGLWMPIVTAMVSDFFSGNERASLMGQVSSAQNIGAIFLTVAGGMLAMYHWNYVYMAYLIAIPGLILTLLFIPDEKPVKPVADTKISNTDKKRSLKELGIDEAVILFSVIQMFFSIPYNAGPNNISLLLAERGLGTSQTAGIMSGLFLFGGILSGIYFGWLDKKVGKLTIPIGFAFISLGLFGLGIAKTIPVIMMFCVIGGMSLPLVLPQSSLGVVSGKKKSQYAMATAFLMALGNLGVFIAPVNTSLAAAVTGNNSVACRLLFAAAFSAIAALATFVILRKNK